jgi:uncharacterized membrane protein YkvA (DUF1232 family)
VPPKRDGRARPGPLERTDDVEVLLAGGVGRQRQIRRSTRRRWSCLIDSTIPGADDRVRLPGERAEQAEPRIASTSQVASKGKRRRKGNLMRALRWLAFMPVASRAPMYARLIWALVTDARVPAGRKALLVAAAGYVLVGRDIIPDDIPVLGGIDDLAVVVLAVELFLDSVPEDVLEEKILELEIDEEAFRRDMAQVRRLTPAPVRRIIRRLPDAMDAAGRLVKQTRIGPKVRSWITDARQGRPSKEESFA